MDKELWAPAGVKLRCGDVELRYPDDADLFELAHLAGRGVHPPSQMPFSVPWTRGTPHEVATGLLRYQWRTRADATPEGWNLELAVVRHADEGEQLVGLQAAEARSFAVTRSAETGSWLGLEHQGKGLGTVARRMMLHLLFEGLGAQVATTAAFADNAASTAVTRRLGYEPNGQEQVNREGTAAIQHRYRLTRERWEAQPDRPHVEMSGVARLREFLGLDELGVAL